MKKGFTLIELLVVVLIIGILSAVAMPQYTKAVKKSRISGVVSKLKTILQAGEAYMLANDLSSNISGSGFVVSLGIDQFDISLPSETEDLKGFTCTYLFKWVSSPSTDVKYMATCDGTVTARGNNWIQNGTQLAQNAISEAEYLVASSLQGISSIKDAFGNLSALSNLRLGVVSDPFSFSYPMDSWLAMPSPDWSGGEPGSGMSIGLTNTGHLFCGGKACKEYGFTKISELSSEADLLAHASTLYTM